MEPLWTAFPAFVLVGALTTGLDMSVYNLLCARRWAVIPANLVSCTMAMAFSYTANRHFSFGATDGAAAGQCLRFVLVTLTSSFGLQNLVLWAWSVCFGPIAVATEGLGGTTTTRAGLAWQRNMAKASAVGLGMVWNYLWYRLWVFPHA